jgi:hypothetical protein
MMCLGSSGKSKRGMVAMTGVWGRAFQDDIARRGATLQLFYWNRGGVYSK